MRTIFTTLLLLCFSFLCFSPTPATQLQTPESHSSRAGAPLAEIVRKLRHIEAVEGDTVVPPAAVPLLVELRSGLRELVSETVGASSADISAEDLQRTIAERLMRIGVALTPRDAKGNDPNYGIGAEGAGSYSYGGILDISARRFEHNPDVLAVTATLSINCGDDTALWVFRRTGKGWTLALAREAAAYDEVNGAFGSFQYFVSPREADGDFFVVSALSHPWCTSNWRTVSYQVARPGARWDRPRILLDAEDSLFQDYSYRGNNEEATFALSKTADGFELRHRTLFALDSGLHNRESRKRFVIQGASVVRVGALSDTPQGFLDEWLNLDWNAAARWTVPAGRAKLASPHARFHKTDRPYTEIFLLQPCPDSPDRWHIGVLCGEEKFYFVVIRKNDAFYVESAGTTRPAGCPGETSPHGSEK